MIGLAWQTLKQAQEALKTGRLEEAHRLLSQRHVQNQKRTGELLLQLMRAYVARGEKALRQDDAVSAWNDLLKAEEMGFTDNAPVRLRQALTRLGLAQARALLETGEPIRACDTINQLRQWAVRQPELDPMEEAAKNWVLARDLSENGEFAKAREMLDRTAKLLPVKFRSFEEFRTAVAEKSQIFSPLLVKLHEAVQQKRWQDVLDHSEQILAIAPQHADARRLRSQAWKAIEPTTVGPVHPARPREPRPETPSNRFIMWIDGVGGFLVCLGNRVTFGQAGPDAFCDIPIFADILKSHVTLSRDGEGYSLEASKPIQVNGKVIEKGLLRTGDRVTLGSSCQLLFRQPVAITATARLDLVSGHRLGLPVDGVLLMAETLVLGPENGSHVEILGLKAPLFLYRSREVLGIRSKEKLVDNGQIVKESSRLEMGATISGHDFSITLEAISPSYLRRY
jgi:tetratricopeptide (TPR) repeat protein